MKKTDKHAGRRTRRTATAVALLAAAHALAAQSPYIDRVYEYMPAPGQFINELPEYEPGDTREDMRRKAEEAIAHDNQGMISLGGYGGYVVFGFDHMVENLPGRYDFRVMGNAFYAEANPNGAASREGGSCEPGIVMVSYDRNGNGLPDDEWNELAGSDYRKSSTVHGYEITYHRPAEGKTPEPHPSYPYINDLTYIRWTTNGHGEGYLYRNTFHSQSYYPLWVSEPALSFRGTKLADNYVDESGTGTYYVQYASHWGYVDNQPNTDPRSGFNIEWAVDAAGNPVTLPGIHFVKVYTGVNQYCGWLGETSTEVLGAEDLHLLPDGRDVLVPTFVSGISLDRSGLTLQTGSTASLHASLAPADATNRAITWRSLTPSVATVGNDGTVSAIAAGEAIIQAIANDGYYIAQCRVSVSQAGEPGRVSGVSLDYSRLDIPAGQSGRLQATVSPATATDKSVRWSASDYTVADVTADGRVYAFAPGVCTITVTTTDGGHTATCTVHVTNEPDDGTATRPPADSAAPFAYFAGGNLHLLNLEGCRCTLISLAGQSLYSIRPASPHEVRPVALHPGVYLLIAGRDGSQTTFKLFFRQ
ncbi:MAG: Ig-like domain-containing protein [Tannerellaceae bacterium]|jgi:hypothetical protein|nr:Ig-like domain-containing protein [Tannerellaceae bacterium]